MRCSKSERVWNVDKAVSRSFAGREAWRLGRGVVVFGVDSRRVVVERVDAVSEFRGKVEESKVW